MKEEFSLKDLMLIFKRRLGWFWFAFVVSVGVSIAYAFLSPPVYEATARLKIESSGGIGPLTGEMGGFFGLFPAPSGVTTEMEMIKSRTNLKKVVEILGLFERFKKENPEITLQGIVRKLEDMIEVEPVKNSNIVEIKVESEDPKLSADIANTLVEVYDEFLKDLSKNQYTLKREFIEKQLPKVEKELKEAEDRLREFKERNGIFIINEDAKQFLNIVYSYDKQLNGIEIQLKETKADMEFIQDQLSKTEKEVISSKTISLNPVVTQLRSQLVSLMVELSGLKAVYPSNNPKVLEIERKIEETENLLKDEVERIVMNQVQVINPMYTKLITQLFTDKAKIKALEIAKEHVENLRKIYLDRLKEFPKLEQELIELTREMKIKENLYTLLVQKLEEVRIAEAGILGNVQIVDRADVPEIPSKPRKKLVVAIGGAIGIFLGIFLAFLREFTDDRVRDEYSLMWNFNVQDIWKLRKMKKFEYIALDSSQDLKNTVSDIILKLERGNVLSITSPSKEDGKTFLAINLALYSSKLGLRVVLLTFDPFPAKDVFNLSRGRKVHDGVYLFKVRDDLDIFTLKGDLSISTFSAFVKDLKSEYDLVILDLPPLSVPETALYLRNSASTVLVLRSRKTRFEDLKRALKKIELSKVELLGVVLNFSR